MPGGHTAATQPVVLRGEPDRSAREALHWLRSLADGNGFARPRACHRAGGSRGRDNPRTQHGCDLVARRSADKAAYTIETTFDLPADFPGGGIANVPGILMKQSEQARVRSSQD